MPQRRIPRAAVADVDIDEPALHRRQQHERVGIGLERLERIEHIAHRDGGRHRFDRFVQAEYVSD